MSARGRASAGSHMRGSASARSLARAWPGITIALLISGCSAALVRPTPQDAQWAAARWPGTTVDELDKGRAIYVRKCDGCHNLRRPEEYPAERWPSLVDHMGERVELTADERERMIRYLTTSSARVRGHEDASEKDLSDSSRPGTE